LARRARETFAEYARFFAAVAFLSVSFLAEVVCAEAAGVGQPNAAIAVKRQINRAILNGRARVTGKPL
jgi:hypothetical protein